MSASKEINDHKGKRPLGIIAGSGSLPRIVISAMQQAGRPVFVAALKGSADQDPFDDVSHECGGSIVKAFRAEGVVDLVMIGGVNRPNFTDIRPDLWTATGLAKLGLKALGDNDLLVCIKDALEEEGFILRGVHEIVPDLLTPAGLLSKVKPDKKTQIDIERGIEVAQALGAVDVGQSVIVCNGIVLGVEGAEGTDKLIERCAALRHKDKGGVLVKLCKPQQDTRLDLPTIGVKTVENLYMHGFQGLAVQAGRSLMPERAALIKQANQKKIFVLGVEL